jgi:probable F420-dependent oxidoreductase
MADFGVLMFTTEYSIAPQVLASAAEARGFESLFLPEHTHIPASRESPWPGGRELPREYWNTYDPFVSLAAAAVATQTLKLGTGITLITEREPILMAKQVATLDKLSNGRVLLGVGAGWNREEMENHGTDYTTRWSLLQERIEAMRSIWSDEDAEYHGRHVNFDPLWAFPKPVQAGGPPVLLGASSRWVYDRIATYGDGWMPIHQDESRAAAQGAVNYAEGISRTRDAWQAASRSGEPDFSIFGVGPDGARIEALLEMGFNRIIMGLPSADADTVVPLLDRYAAIAGAING